MIDFESLGEDRFIVAEYLRTCDRIFESALYSSGIKKFSISIRANSSSNGPSFEVQGPSEVELRSAMLDFRKLISDREPVFLFKVLKLLYLKFEGRPDQHEIVKVRDHLQKTLNGEYSTINLGIRKLDSGTVDYIRAKELLDLWINGHLFHSDRSKTLKFRKIQSKSPEISYFLLLEIVYSIAYGAIHLAILFRRNFDLPNELKKDYQH